MSNSATSGTAACQASLPFTISRSLLKCMSIEAMTPSYHLILCRPLLLLPSVFPSTRVFSNELALRIKWPKSWSFSINPSNEYSGLISFRMDWLDLLAVQGTLKSLLQHHSLKASILWHLAFGQKIQSDSRPNVRIGFRAQLRINLLYLSIHDAIALPPNSSPTLFLQTQQNKTFPKENFQTSCQEGKKHPKHSLSYYTNFYCLNVVSLPTSFSAAFLWNYSVAFSRWENPRSQRKTHIISIHKLIRAPTETVLIIYLQKTWNCFSLEKQTKWRNQRMYFLITKQIKKE